MTRGMKSVLAAILVSFLLLGGCGDDPGTSGDEAGSTASTADDTAGSDTPSVETSAPAEPTPSESELTPTETASPLPDWPACADVWVADAKLPSGYEGCLDSGTAVKAKNRFCEFGKKLVTYADQFWAVRGGRINDAKGPLEESKDYENDLQSCQG